MSSKPNIENTSIGPNERPAFMQQSPMNPSYFPAFEPISHFQAFNPWAYNPFDIRPDIQFDSRSLLVDPSANIPSYLVGYPLENPSAHHPAYPLVSPLVSQKDPTEEDLGARFYRLNNTASIRIALTERMAELTLNGRTSVVFFPFGVNSCDMRQCCICGIDNAPLTQMYTAFVDPFDQDKSFPDVSKMTFTEFFNSFIAGISNKPRTFCQDCVKCYEFVISNPSEGFSNLTCEKFKSRCKEIAEKEFMFRNMTPRFATETQITLDVLVMYKIFNTRNHTFSITQYKPRETSTHIKLEGTVGKKLIAMQGETKEKIIRKWISLV